MSKDVLLYSGGVDSLIAWYYMREPATMYIDLGHKYAHSEKLAMNCLPPCPVMLESHYGELFEEEDAHIAGRNFYLAMYAAACGNDVIWLVTQAGEQNVPDRTPEFYSKSSEALSMIFGRPIELRNVFPVLHKHEMVQWYVKSGHPVEHLRTAWSCYTPKFLGLDGFATECGVCSTCFRKYIALEYNDINTNGLFWGDIHQWGLVNYVSRLNEYSWQRVEAIAKVYLKHSERNLGKLFSFAPMRFGVGNPQGGE